MRAALTFAVLLAGCLPVAGEAPDDPPLAYGSVSYTVGLEPDGSVKVVGGDTIIGAADKAKAVEIANQYCREAGVVASDADRFEDEAWIFPGGCG